MPYKSIDDESLPKHVKEMDADGRKVWVETFNGVFYKCREDDGEDCDGRAMKMANAAAKVKAGDMADGFLFVDLASLTPGKPFTGFAAGTFVDMRGREIVLAAKDIADFVKNTLALIGEYKARNMPGLPIDEMLHNKGKAAGWITGAEAGEVQDSAGNNVPVIRLLAEWTKIGVELLKEKIQTNFSPTVDLENKAIRGGSLTNWPATVDGKGIPLFAAVELSRGVWGLVENPMSEETTALSVDETVIDTAVTEPAIVDPQPEPAGNGVENMTVELSTLSDEQRAQLLQEAKQTVLADLSPGEGDAAEEAIERLRKELNFSAFADVADLGKARDAMFTQMQAALKSEYDRMQANAGKMLAEMMSQIKRDQHIAELSQQWTGGNDKHPRGFPVGREEMEAFLGSLNEGQRRGAESIFGRIHEQGLIEFRELGHGRTVKGTAELEKPYAALLDRWIKDGNTIDEFFDINPELGDAAQYNLSKYQEAK